LACPDAPLRARRALRALIGRVAAAALALAAALPLGGCEPGPGYELVPAGASGPSDTSGRLAIAWTLKGQPLTAALCQSEHIDSMDVFITSEGNSQDQAEFQNVVCGLDRYSMAMIPSGQVGIEVDAVHHLNGQTDCARYAGIAYAKASSQFAPTPTPVALLPVVSCP
jgi:hypothetical protein